MKKEFNFPIKLESNKAWRTYLGGKLIKEWLNELEQIDDHFPERWIASVVSARNQGRNQIKEEGISTLTFNNIKWDFKEFTMKYGEKIFGVEHSRHFGNNPGMLIKVLDSMERLAIQVHPNNTKAKALFNSSYGKTEGWHILKTRTLNDIEPYILLGFKQGITKEKWKTLFENQDILGMVDALNKFHVKEGDTWLIKGGVPHAIGPGCLILEIQEPTDYTIRVEKVLSNGLELDEQSIHQGIGFNNMFNCFEYKGYSKEEIIDKWLITPTTNKSEENIIELLISKKDTTKFGLEKLIINTKHSILQNNVFSVLVIYNGCGSLKYNNHSIDICKGDTILLPYGLKRIDINTSSKQPMYILRCLPPIH